MSESIKGVTITNMWDSNGDRLGGNQHHRVEALDLCVEAKINAINLCLNCTAWDSTNPDHTVYRDRIAEYIQAIKARGMRYHIRLHRDGIEYDRIGNPGWNYKIALKTIDDKPNPVRDQALNFYRDIARIYGDDPDLIGITLLNEPYSECEDTDIQDAVLQFYREGIEIIRAENPDVWVFLMYPCKWAGLPIHWKTAGYPVLSEYPRVGGEYHQHYFNWDNRAWGLGYKISAEEGHKAFDEWLTENIDPVLADGYKVILGEFSIVEETRLWRDVMEAQCGLHTKRGCGWFLWWMRNDHDVGVLANDGRDWNPEGQAFAEYLSGENGDGNGGETVGKVININPTEDRTFNLVNREVITLQPGEEHEVPGLPGDIELK